MISQTFMCKCVILLPLFVTLLLIDEDPYVGVDVIHDLNPTSSSAKRGRSENNAFTLKTIQPCYLRFSLCFSKYIPLKIRSTNESRLFPGNRHFGVKGKIKQSFVKWIEPNCAFQITKIFLFYPLHLFFFFIIHF